MSATGNQPKTGSKVGDTAPDFTLPDQNGKPVALSDLLSWPSGAGHGRT